MCGIYGVVGLDGGVISAGLLERMAGVQVHRGPDDEGSITFGRAALGMRRLSIIDVSGGQQPLANRAGTVWTVCNGEIYNFRELREGLAVRGHVFGSGSDAEVIPHLYDEHGLDFLTHLNGMFGLALWDEPRGRFVLARDRLGIKPIYYARIGDQLVFASEAKSILNCPGFERRVDEEALAEFLALGYVPAPRSMFQGISKLPPASVMIVEGGRIEVREYWRLPQDVDASVTEQEWVEELLRGMRESVHRQLVSDVPLGAFLSGGLDSSAVVALMTEFSTEPVKTYSIGFGGSSGGSFYNELPFARQVAERFRTDHREILVEPDIVSLLPKLIWHMDEPTADSAFITTYLVSEFARRDVTVILSGVGGDELFGGYRRYLGSHYLERLAAIPAWLRRGIARPLLDRLPVDRHSSLTNYVRYARQLLASEELPPAERYRSYVEVLPRALRNEVMRNRRYGPDALDRAFERAEGRDLLRQLFDVDSQTQLPDDLLLLTDKMTMATSLECRVPILDHELVETAARIPAGLRIKNGELKHLMKAAVRGLLPDSIIDRKKRGFGAPMGAWLKQELAGLLGHLVNERSVAQRGWLDWPVVERLIDDHRSSRVDYTDLLIALVNLEVFARIFLDGQSADELSAELAEQCR